MVDNRILELNARLSGDEDLQKFINNVSRLEKETYLASASAQRADRAFAKFVKDSSKIEDLRKKIHGARVELEKFKDANDITNPDVYAKVGEQYLQLKDTLKGLNQQYDSLTNNVKRCYAEMKKSNEEYRTDLFDTGILASGVNLFEIIMGRNADKVPDDPLGALLGIDKDVLQKYSESYGRSISDLNDQLLKLNASRPHGDIYDPDFGEERAAKIRETQKAIKELTDAQRLLVRVMDIQIQRQKTLSAEQEAYSLQQRQIITDQIVADYHQLIGTGTGVHEGKQTNVLDVVQERTEGSLKENPYNELLSTNPEELKEKYAYFQNALANIQKQRILVSSLSPDATGAPEETRARQQEDLKRLDQTYHELYNSMKLIESVVQEQMDTGLFSETFGERGKSIISVLNEITHGLLGVQSTALGDAAALRELGTATDYLTNKQLRQSHSLEGLMRKHRWIQSYLLVTGNFMQKLGNGIAALGSILTLITLPAILLLTIFLTPFIPIIAGIVKGMADWIIKLKELPDWIKLVVGGIILVAVSSGALVMVVKKIWDMVKWTKYFYGILKMSGVFSTLVTSGKAAFTLLIGYAKTAARAVLNIGRAAVTSSIGVAVLKGGVAVLAGSILGAAILWAIYESESSTAIHDSIHDFYQLQDNISMVLRYLKSNFETWFALLVAEAQYAGLKLARGLIEPLQDIPLLGELFSAILPGLDDSIEKQRQLLEGTSSILSIFGPNGNKISTPFVSGGLRSEWANRYTQDDIHNSWRDVDWNEPGAREKYGAGDALSRLEDRLESTFGDGLNLKELLGVSSDNSQQVKSATDAIKDTEKIIDDTNDKLDESNDELDDLNSNFSDYINRMDDLNNWLDLEEPLGDVSDELINNTAALGTYNKLFEDYSKSIDTQKENMTLTIPAAATGAEVKRTGLLTVHSGEKVIPADISRKIDSGSIFGKLTEMIMSAVQAPTIQSSSTNISEAISNNSVTNEVRSITTSITNNNQKMKAPKEEESPARIELIYNGHAFIDSYVDRRVKEILNHIGVRI